MDAHPRSRSRRFPLVAGCAVALATTLAGCNYHALKPVSLVGEAEKEDQVLQVNRDVDILFVIDNSRSMGEEQALLAKNFGSFIEVLEAKDVEANYRIGVTTTDNGNPRCYETTPESGHLVLSSCKGRIDEFLFDSIDDAQDVDVRDLACNDICPLSDEELTITPTTTDVDSSARPRPWLENIEGQKNIPASTSTVDAFQCFGPQGIRGCGFESPLESMYLSLVRAQDTAEAEYGFLRAQAILAIVVVSDEADCSYNEDYAEIFANDGNKAFWADPEGDLPTSAVCWNAGVVCTGDPSHYDSCEPVNKDVDGNVGVSDDDAVLHPMSRYYGLLDGIEQQKKELDDSQELIVGLIGGVDAEGVAHYADAMDVDFQTSFGIGPGCTAPPPEGTTSPVTAVPPVREKALVDRYTEGNMFSICEDDYSFALEAIAKRIKDQIRPACYTLCADDTDPSTLTVEPWCDVVEELPDDQGTVDIEECATDASGSYIIDPTSNDYVMPAEDVDVCFAMLTDDMMATSSTADDMSPECTDQNYNLEFEIARRPGVPAVAGSSISATCTLADFPDISCPGIGG
jgi:hypothetical protein